MNQPHAELPTSSPVIVRPTADGGVTVNGVGLWPDSSPKDRDGFVIGISDSWVVRYNFETGEAEAEWRDIHEERPEAVVAYMVLAVLLAALTFTVSLFMGWIF